MTALAALAGLVMAGGLDPRVAMDQIGPPPPLHISQASPAAPTGAAAVRTEPVAGHDRCDAPPAERPAGLDCTARLKPVQGRPVPAGLQALGADGAPSGGEAVADLLLSALGVSRQDATVVVKPPPAQPK